MEIALLEVLGQERIANHASCRRSKHSRGEQRNLRICQRLGGQLVRQYAQKLSNLLLTAQNEPSGSPGPCYWLCVWSGGCRQSCG